MVTVTFACGHRAQVGTNVDTQPCCPECGERTVQRVKARAPRFVGVATGPYAETKALDAIAVNLAPKGPLKIKEPE